MMLFAPLFWSRAALTEIRYAAGQERDPFFKKIDDTGIEAGVEEVQNYGVLEGLLWTPGKKKAIVSGRRVGEGDTVVDAEIVEITKKGLRLKRGVKEGFLTKKGIEWK